jgi:3D (Asp-Asp-Asp) domain-containing protein
MVESDMAESDTVPICSERSNNWKHGKERENRKKWKARSLLYANNSKKIAASVIAAAVLITVFFMQYCKSEVSIDEEDNSLLLTQKEMVSADLDKPGEPAEKLIIACELAEKHKTREALPFTTVRVNNPDLDYGVVRVIEEGAEGIIEHVVEVEKKDGREISREVVSSEIIKVPVNRVLEYGEKNTISRGGRNYQYAKVLYVNATAYCPGTRGSGCPIDEWGAAHCTGFYNDGLTATGKKAVAGDGSITNPHIIAVDPAVIPLKAMVYLEGYGFAVAEDTGSAIKKNSIDLLFDYHDDARGFGRKELKAYLLADLE